jgi:peptidoglycan-associated lipoprotein
MAASISRDRPKDQEDDVISAFLPKSLRRWNAGVAVFAALFVVACTCATGPVFRVTAPAAGGTLSAEACRAVAVTVTAVPGDYCAFPPKAYEISVDGGASQTIPADKAPLTATFNNLSTGPHTANGWAIGANGKRRETASVKFTCAPPPPPPTPVPTPVPTPEPTPAPPPPAPAEEMVTITQKGGYLEDIFFDFNKFAIKPEYHERLARGAEWIKNHPETKVTIEGHCDQRGSIKYNQILGEKRARLTRDHMIKLGVDPARMTVTSVGKEQPFDAGQNEQAFASNRRSHFIITKR